MSFQFFAAGSNRSNSNPAVPQEGGPRCLRLFKAGGVLRSAKGRVTGHLRQEKTDQQTKLVKEEKEEGPNSNNMIGEEEENNNTMHAKAISTGSDLLIAGERIRHSSRMYCMSWEERATASASKI